MANAMSPRLFVGSDLAGGIAAALSEAQAHYLRHVMRRSDGSDLRLFNGRDGEWQATLEARGKKAAVAHVGERTRQQEPEPAAAAKALAVGERPVAVAPDSIRWRICPRCSAQTLRRQEGCLVCDNCGYSKCN